MRLRRLMRRAGLRHHGYCRLEQRFQGYQEIEYFEASVIRYVKTEPQRNGVPLTLNTEVIALATAYSPTAALYKLLKVET